jgi:hypothetical protein
MLRKTARKQIRNQDETHKLPNLPQEEKYLHRSMTSKMIDSTIKNSPVKKIPGQGSFVVYSTNRLNVQQERYQMSPGASYEDTGATAKTLHLAEFRKPGQNEQVECRSKNLRERPPNSAFVQVTGTTAKW